MAMTMAAISEEMALRRISQSPFIESMMAIRDRYNADVVVPVPDTDDDLPYESLAPLLIADAVDHPAMYAVQAPPNIFVPAIEFMSSPARCWEEPMPPEPYVMARDFASAMSSCTVVTLMLGCTVNMSGRIAVRLIGWKSRSVS